MATGNSIAVYGGLFTKYLPGYMSMLSRKSGYRTLPFGKMQWEGDKLAKKLNVRWNTSVHNTSDGGAIKPAGNVLFVEANGTRKFVTASAALTDGLMATAKSAKNSAAAAASFLLKNTLEMHARYENFMLPRDGTGKVATLGTTVSGSYITVSDGRGFHPGADYEIRSAATPTTVIASFTVKYVQRATTSGEAVVYTDAAVPAGGTKGDIITWGVGDYSSYGRAITGLDTLIDDGLVTFQNVDCSLYPYYTSYVYDNGGSAFNITTAIFRQVRAALKQEAEDFKVPGGQLVMTSQWDATNIEPMFENQIRLTPDSKAVGFSGGLTFKDSNGEFTLVAEHDHPYGKVFFIDRSKISRPTQQEADWRRIGGEVFTPSPNKLSYYATLVEISDLFIEERHTSAKIEGMSVTPATGY